MMLSLSKDNHVLKAGDININESEYTVSGLGRRGMEYAYDNQKAYVHVFDVSSQQPKGFKGFGIPKSEISIFGGVAGYTFYENKISVRAIYIGGKDNPQQGVNVGTPSSNTGREGNVMALVEETRLFENKLNLKAEFARSNYDGDLTDNMEAIGDNALNLGAGFSYGAFSLGASYKYVGKDFNSIGLQYLTNDRKGYEATIGLRTDRVNLTGSSTMQKDNVKSDPTKYTTRDNNSNLNLSLTLSGNVSLNFGYKRDKQKTFQGDVETSLQDSLTNEYSGALNLSLKQSANINISFTNSRLSSENNPQNDTSAFTLNLGGSFRRGESFSLTPTFGYSKASNKFTAEETITYNSLLTGEIAFVPRLFSLLFSGSFARSELSPDNISNLLDIGGGLNLYLDKLIKIGSIVFSLKGSYNHSDLPGVQSSDYKIFLQCDFSF